MAPEKATIESENPFKADGLTAAIKTALKDSGKTFEDVDYRIVDVNGEHYAFKEASLALSRSMHILKEEFDIWHPSDCIGETGAAVGPIVLGIALDAARKGYAPGDGVLCHFSNDDGLRSAMVLRYTG
jgi:3-oxoacyl-[acyl-carrier-protein] synthase I